MTMAEMRPAPPAPAAPRAVTAPAADPANGDTFARQLAARVDQQDDERAGDAGAPALVDAGPSPIAPSPPPGPSAAAAAPATAGADAAPATAAPAPIGSVAAASAHPAAPPGATPGATAEAGDRAPLAPEIAAGTSAGDAGARNPAAAMPIARGSAPAAGPIADAWTARQTPGITSPQRAVARPSLEGPAMAEPPATRSDASAHPATRVAVAARAATRPAVPTLPDALQPTTALAPATASASATAPIIGEGGKLNSGAAIEREAPGHAMARPEDTTMPGRPASTTRVADDAPVSGGSSTRASLDPSAAVAATLPVMTTLAAPRSRSPGPASPASASQSIATATIASGPVRPTADDAVATTSTVAPKPTSGETAPPPARLVAVASAGPARIDASMAGPALPPGADPRTPDSDLRTQPIAAGRRADPPTTAADPMAGSAATIAPVDAGVGALERASAPPPPDLPARGPDASGVVTPAQPGPSATTPSALAPAPTLAIDSGPIDWAPALAEVVATLAASAPAALRLKLRPATLGAIDVAVAVEAGGARATLTVETAAARAALGGGIELLHGLAAAGGLRLDQSTVVLATAAGGGETAAGSADPRGHHEPRGGQPPATASGAGVASGNGAPAPRSPSPGQANARHGGLINVYA